MRKVVLSQRARSAMTDVLAHSVATFGTGAARRYKALLRRSFRDLALDPQRPGSWAAESGTHRVGLYHIRHSRNALEPGNRVKTPRHIVVFQAFSDRVLILDLVHETRDRPAALARALAHAEPEPEPG